MDKFAYKTTLTLSQPEIVSSVYNHIKMFTTSGDYHETGGSMSETIGFVGSRWTASVIAGNSRNSYSWRYDAYNICSYHRVERQLLFRGRREYADKPTGSSKNNSWADFRYNVGRCTVTISRPQPIPQAVLECPPSAPLLRGQPGYQGSSISGT